MEFKGGNIQIGSLNRQFINSTDNSNNNNLTLNVNINVMNCTPSCQHQYQEYLTVSGEGVHKLIDCLKSIAPSPGLTTQDASEAGFQSQSDPEVLAQLDPAFQSQSDPEVYAQLDPAFKSQSDPEVLAQLDAAFQSQSDPEVFAQLNLAFQSQSDPKVLAQLDPAFQSQFDPEVYAQLDPAFKTQSDPEAMAQLVPAFQPQSDPEVFAQLDPTIQTQMLPQRVYKSTNVPALTTSLAFSDSQDRKIRPGDAVQTVRGHMVPIFTVSMYVGAGYAVCYHEELQVVVKARIDMTRPYKKFIPTKRGTVKVFPPKLRVKRALKKVGQPCPVPGCGEDFAFWTFTGLDTQQSTERGFTLDLVSC